jgi:uncharacterized protein YkwD
VPTLASRLPRANQPGGLRRTIAIFGLCSLLFGVCALLPSTTARADSTHTAQEWTLLNLMNRDRAINGVGPPLTMSVGLHQRAQYWASTYDNSSGTSAACQASAFSDDPGGPWGTGSMLAAANAGCGPDDPATLEAAYMASPQHRANILDPALVCVGVGWSVAPDGTAWNAVDFVSNACRDPEYPAPPPSGPNWAPTWEPLQGSLTSSPDASSWGPGRLDVFVRGAGNQLYHRWHDGAGWSPDYEPLGAPNPPTGYGITSDPTAVSWGSSRIDVFARGTDNALWHTWFDGAWRGWESLGGALTSGPDVASWGQGRLDVFVRGLDNNLWHRSYDNGSWQLWEPLVKGQLTSDPSAVSWAPGRIDVFGRGTDNALWHTSYDGIWHSWEPLSNPGDLTSGPDASSWGPGRLDVFVRGRDNAMWHRWFTGGTWSDHWESLGGTLTSDPSAVSWGSGRIDTFVAGTDLQLYHKWFPY